MSLDNMRGHANQDQLLAKIIEKWSQTADDMQAECVRMLEERDMQQLRRVLDESPDDWWEFFQLCALAGLRQASRNNVHQKKGDMRPFITKDLAERVIKCHNDLDNCERLVKLLNGEELPDGFKLPEASQALPVGPPAYAARVSRPFIVAAANSQVSLLKDNLQRLCDEALAPHDNDGGSSTAAALKTLIAAFRRDAGYAWGWHCNIAMSIIDNTTATHRDANIAAAAIMLSVFEVDVTKYAQWVLLEKEWVRAG